MKKLSVALLVGLMLFSVSSGFAYKEPTHERLSKEAVSISVLQSDNQVLSNLGLKPLDDPEQKFLNSEGNPRTIIDLVGDGAWVEDNGTRFFQHFYDPINDLSITDPLWISVLTLKQKSPDWALEDRITDDRQNNSFRDARLHFLCALTGGTDLHCQDQGFIHPDQEWGWTFQTLGQIIHLLQDMAQPSHVRNEAHPIGRRARYEVDSQLFFEGFRLAPLPPALLNYAPVYPSADPTAFNTPRKFWVTQETSDSNGPRGTGKGMAEFTVNNFVSFRQNFRLAPGTDPTQPLMDASAILPDADHPWPDNTNAEVTSEDVSIQSQLPFEPTPIDGKIYYIGTPITDKYRSGQSGFNTKTSTFSIYDEDLRIYNDEVRCYSRHLPSGDRCTTQGIFHLNSFNYAEARKFLIPRAIGYSAGLINYFFRGKINVVLDNQVAGQDLIKNEGTERLKGIFFLYYDAQDGKRYPVLRDAAGKAAGWTTPPDDLAAGATMPLPVFLPPTDATTPGEYMLVFHGTMGEETDHAVAGRVVQISPCPTTQPLPPYGITEWWGPGCVRLSWHGPFARYSTMRHTSELSEQIFSHGRVVATAPGRVIGTALQRDAQSGQQFLLAVVAGTESSGGVQLPDSPDRTGWVTSEKLYARGLQSPAEWVLVRQFGVDLDNGTAYPAPYYFNESGTTAVNGASTFLSVTAASGEASRYDDPGPTQEPITHSTNTDCDPTGTSCSSSSTSDSSSEAEMAADYQGDHLVRLYWHGKDHYESSHTDSRDASSFAGSSSGGAAWTSSQRLTTTTGWEWDLTQEMGSGFSSNEWTDYRERTTRDDHQFHQTSLRRRVDSLDLRFNPPLVAYVERQATDDSEYRAGHDNFYVWQVSLDNTTATTHEQFTWLIHGGGHDVEPSHSLPRNHPGHFAGGNASEITVGGTSAHPQIQAAHHYLDFVVDGNSYEGFQHDFAYAGDSGGPER